MAAAGRRGRRDNGLDAVDWRAIDDLDPRVSEEVLDALGTRGIAAYVQPAMDVDPVTRSTTVPDRPADRLYVDRQQAEAARECVRGLLGGVRGRAGAGGGGAATDVDATFAGIVADFNRAPDPTGAYWPAAENVPGSGGGDPADEPPEGADVPGAATTTAAPAPAGPTDGRHVTEPSLLDGLDTFGADLPDEELPERFVPPTPPPLPRLSRQTVLGWLAIMVGLVLVLGRPDVLALDRNTTVLLGFASVLGGAVALILRLRPGTDPEERTHPDDGAQV